MEATQRAENAVAYFESARAKVASEKRAQNILFTVLLVSLITTSAIISDVNPRTLIEGLPGIGNYIYGTIPTVRAESFLADISEWYWGIGRWMLLLLDTILIAFLGTLLGATGAFLVGFSASRNLAPHPILYFICRRIFEIGRTVPELVYALIFVYSFGLGPFPGMLAVAIHTMGALGKLYSEVNENVDLKPLEGIRAAGGNWVQTMRFGVVPQVLPNYVSYTLLRFEINIRASSILGFVGAGGIGQELYLAIKQFYYVDISAIVLLILATVTLMDLSCEQVRHRLIGEDLLQ